MSDLSEPIVPSVRCWQLAIIPLPITILEGPSGPHRPSGCFVVDVQSGYCFKPEIASPETGIVDLAMASLASALEKSQGRWPEMIQVRDPELATALRPALAGKGVRVEVSESLEMLDEVTTSFLDHVAPGTLPSWLDEPGTDADLLRFFASSASRYHAAAPWRLLHDDDVIVIESPQAPPGMAAASVLGAGGEVFGIAFHASLKEGDALSDGERLEEKWSRYSLMFHEFVDTPPRDSELWQDLGLATVGDTDLQPVFFRYSDSGHERPSAEHTRFAAGVCYAMAMATEAQIDSGRWEQVVPTPAGPVVYRLTIPHLLEQPIPLRQGPMVDRREMEQTHFRFTHMARKAGCKTTEEMSAFAQTHMIGKRIDEVANSFEDPKDIALDLCYSSLRHYSRRRMRDLLEALKLDPDCAEAYVMLAELASNDVDRCDLYQRAAEAGRRRLGEEAFADPEYPFWRTIESRSYMRAIQGLADTSLLMDRFDDSAAKYRELLELNPGDNQGARYLLVEALIAGDRLAEAVRTVRTVLLAKQDVSALGEWVEAVFAFVTNDPEQTTALRQAAKKNRLVPYCLDGEEDSDDSGPWTPGSLEEAVWIADAIGPAFGTEELSEDFIRRAKAATVSLDRKVRKLNSDRPAAKKARRKKK